MRMLKFTDYTTGKSIVFPRWDILLSFVDHKSEGTLVFVEGRSEPFWVCEDMQTVAGSYASEVQRYHNEQASRHRQAMLMSGVNGGHR